CGEYVFHSFQCAHDGVESARILKHLKIDDGLVVRAGTAQANFTAAEWARYASADADYRFFVQRRRRRRVIDAEREEIQMRVGRIECFVTAQPRHPLYRGGCQRPRSEERRVGNGGRSRWTH